MLSGIIRAAVRADSPDRLYLDICHIAVECGLFSSAWIGVADPSRGTMRLLAGQSPNGDKELTPVEHTLAARVLVSREVCVLDDLLAPAEKGGDALIRSGTAGIAGVPLREADKIAAVFMLYAGEEGCFDETTRALLHELGNDLSFSLDRMNGEQRRLAAESKLYYMAFYDAQTGLPNRALLEQRLPMLAKDGLALLDIRLLRLDRALHLFGRLAMDEVLRTLSARLEDRRGEGFLAKLGQDEFALALPMQTAAADVERLAGDLLEALGEPVRIGEREVFLGASIGAAMFPLHETDVTHLLRRARAAADRAGGDGGICFYRADMDRGLEQRARTEAELHRALERGEFQLYYQPQLNLRTGLMVGVEALLQWQHPQRGLVGPGEFVPLLEECGLMPAVGGWALRQACRQAKEWQAMGLPPLRVGVNLSALQFRLAELVSIVHGALNDAGLAPEYLELELTESLILENVEQTIQAMHGLKQLGVSLSLDDFGTGYSSLSYLRRYPVDRIKIDQSFVRDMVSHAGSAAIVRSILAMASNLGLETIAEGVETTEQFEYLRKQRCDEMQGFLFSRGVPPGDITAILREGRRLLSQETTAVASRGVLLAGEDGAAMDELRHALERDDWSVLIAANAAEAFSLLAANQLGVVVSGLQAGGAFLHRVRDMYPDSVRILLADRADVDTIIDAVNCGEVYRVLAKPVDLEQLQVCIRDAYRRFGTQSG